MPQFEPFQPQEFNFTVDKDVQIRAGFHPRSYFLSNYPHLVSEIIEFGFSVSRRLKTIDIFLQNEMISLVQKTLNWEKQVLLVFYENGDGKALGRRRLFNRWFVQGQFQREVHN